MAAVSTPSGYFLIDLSGFNLSQKDLTELEAEINKAVLGKLRHMKSLKDIEFARAGPILGMVPHRPPVPPKL